jgi:hypothetical protein
MAKRSASDIDRTFSVLTLIHDRLPDDAALRSHSSGWNGLLDQLIDFLGAFDE